ncbi:MAG: hypothetical protein PVI80_23425 [Anaerolineae bacterium]
MKTQTATEDTDNVLRLLRSLPPRERLRVVAEVLPELEDQLPATPASPAFWQVPDVQALAERQGVQPIVDLGELLGGWPEDESIDDFLAALADWRQESVETA